MGWKKIVKANDGLGVVDSAASDKLSGIATGADVTSENTAAGIANQGSLATKNSVDLASTEVTNKSLANLDSTANNKLSGIQAGADVTSEHQAASIAGQGALATKSSVDLATEVTNKSLANLDSVANTKLNGIESGAQQNTVDSVNGSTGVVSLSAADVSARPNTWTPEVTDLPSGIPKTKLEASVQSGIVTPYADQASFPSSADVGDLAKANDTGEVYVWVV
jgi:hypothetical protein